ncbi:MAG: hypothetical protein IPO27_12400 [Bacteroidetes bacterium]|nr:hypothetical protein [Bacteroidota bacterium]
MCQGLHHIKLCTCNPELSIDNATWILYRHGITNPCIVGGLIAIYHKKTDLFNESTMHLRFYETLYQNDLNNYNCFDFGYTPALNDKLHIKILFQKSIYILKFIFRKDWQPNYEEMEEYIILRTGKLDNISPTP